MIPLQGSFARTSAVHVSLSSDSNVKQRITNERLYPWSRTRPPRLTSQVPHSQEAEKESSTPAARGRVAVDDAYIGPAPNNCQREFSGNFIFFIRPSQHVGRHVENTAIAPSAIARGLPETDAYASRRKIRVGEGSIVANHAGWRSTERRHAANATQQIPGGKTTGDQARDDKPDETKANRLRR
jgi:hypothetical protein